MIIEDEEKWESYVKALRAWYEGADIQVLGSCYEWVDYGFGEVPEFNNRAWRIKPKTKTLRYMNVLCTSKTGNTWVDVIKSEEVLKEVTIVYKVEKLSDWQTVEVEYD